MKVKKDWRKKNRDERRNRAQNHQRKPMVIKTMPVFGVKNRALARIQCAQNGFNKRL